MGNYRVLGVGTETLDLSSTIGERGTDTESMGNRLEKALEARNVRKIYPLALELGVNESCISRWRRNGSISTDNAIKLCLLLDISVDWLLSGRGDMDQHKERSISDMEYLLIERLRRLPEKLGSSIFSLFEELPGDH